jgi:hypothetical protein
MREGPPITAREIPPSVHNRGLLNDTRAGDGGLQGAVVDRFRGKADIDFFLVNVQLSRKEISHFTIERIGSINLHAILGGLHHHYVRV